MKRFIALPVLSALLFSVSAVAHTPGGSLSCVAKNGQDRVIVEGKFDGELNINEFYTNWLDRESRMDLVVTEISLVDKVHVVAYDPADTEDTTVIRIEAKKAQGKSRAKIEIRNAEEVTQLRGTCTVNFKAGI